jgi:hypothetical protein
MKKNYNNLINMVNEIIKKQMKSKENEGVVILFGTIAKTIIDGKYRLLTEEDVKLSKVGGGTDFLNAFKEAEKYIKNKSSFSTKRILFLTDGKSDSSKLKPICDKMVDEHFNLNIVGFGSKSYFEHLRKFASENCFFTSSNFYEVEVICQNIFAAE